MGGRARSWVAVLLAASCGSSQSGPDALPDGNFENWFLMIDRTMVDLGSVPCGATSRPGVFTLRNVSSSVSLTLETSTMGEGFSLAWNGCSVPLGPGGACQVAVVFHPTRAGTASGMVTVKSERGVQTASLNATGLSAGEVSSSANSHDFGTTPVGQTSVPFTFLIVNRMCEAVDDLEISVGPEFSFTEGGNRCPRSFSTGGCSFDVVFAPLAPGARKSSLVVRGSHGALFTVELTGTGL
jgi:hypothetical protein